MLKLRRKKETVSFAETEAGKKILSNFEDQEVSISRLKDAGEKVLQRDHLQAEVKAMVEESQQKMASPPIRRFGGAELLMIFGAMAGIAFITAPVVWLVVAFPAAMPGWGIWAMIGGLYAGSLTSIFSLFKGIDLQERRKKNAHEKAAKTYEPFISALKTIQRRVYQEQRKALKNVRLLGASQKWQDVLKHYPHLEHIFNHLAKQDQKTGGPKKEPPPAPKPHCDLDR